METRQLGIYADRCEDEPGVSTVKQEKETDDDDASEESESASQESGEGDDIGFDEYGESLAQLDLSQAENQDVYQDIIITQLQNSISAFQSKDNYKHENGDYTHEAQSVVIQLYTSVSLFHRVNNVPRAVVIRWNHSLAHIAIENKILDLTCEIVKDTYPNGWLEENGEVNGLFSITLGLLLNLSDVSSDFATVLTNYPGLCEKIKQLMQDRLEDNVHGSETELTGEVTENAIMLIHNLSMTESNIGRLRKMNFLPILVSYLKSPQESNRLGSFITMAAIINEKECEIIQANPELVDFLLKLLSEASNTQLHYTDDGWTCIECAHSVRMLARNDANKTLLVEHGALQLLVKLGQIGNHDEQLEAVNALWTLAFDTDNKKKICSDEELGVVDLFEKLKDSEDQKIKYACKSALWTIRDQLKSSRVDRYKKMARTTWPSIRRVLALRKQTKDADHVMISYQWDDQKTLIKIRDQLKDAGIKVWMDIDQMGGSTLEAMANAVEGAKLVLMCMSQKYKNSANCRLEAEYAHQRQKTIVPLKSESGYTPDGWLGILCGSKLYFDFSGKYEFEEKMEGLFKEISRNYNRPFEGRGARRKLSLQQADQNPKRTLRQADPNLTQTLRRADQRLTQTLRQADYSHGQTLRSAEPKVTQSLKTIKDWKQEDVQKWIEEHDLKSCNVSKVNGGDVAMLLMMYNRAPESFFKCVRGTLKLKKLRHMSKLVWAISDLTDMQ